MKFLSDRFILHLHAQLIDTFGGIHGLRDADLLASALPQAQAQFDGQPLHEDLAAAYCFHLCRNHAFLDGNKRVAASAMGVVLMLNGVDIRFDEVDLYRTIMGVAEGEVSKAELTAWLRERLPKTGR